MFAFVMNNITVDIYDLYQNKLSDVELQNTSNQISSLTFSDNNTLFIVDNNSTVFVFNQN